MPWYDSGTVAVTNGSATVTGTGTSWVNNAQPGWAFIAPDGDIYEIASVNSDTSLTLTGNYLGSTQTGQTYRIMPTRGLQQNLIAAINALIGNFQGVADGAGDGKFPDGTASVPGVRFTADEDSGLARISDNLIALVAGGVARWLVGSTQLRTDLPLGIGTDPASGTLLHLLAVNSPILRMDDTAQGGYTEIEENGHHLYLRKVSPNVDNAAIELSPVLGNTAGRALVRIGREHDVLWSGDVELHIMKWDFVGGTAVVDTAIVHGGDSYIHGLGAGNLAIRKTVANFPLDVAGEGAFEALRIVDDLPIFRMTDSSTTVASGNVLANLLVNTNAGGTVNSVASLRAVANASNGLCDWVFQTASAPGTLTEVARITSAGWFGLGTAAPARMMHLAGADPIIRMQDTDTAGLYSEIRADGAAGRVLISADVGAQGTGSEIELRTAGVERATIDANGLNLSVPLTGTAVQSGPTDATPGRVLTVGAFGLGDELPAFAGNLDTVDEDIAPGFYWFDGNSVTGTPPQAGGFWHMSLTRRTAGGGELLTATRENTGETWRRWRVAGSWSDWFKVYDQTNAVGTVSQVGGDPTGAIIETGSGANGYFTKFADGTQECRFTLSVGATGATTWTFPETFTATTAVDEIQVTATGVGSGFVVPTVESHATTGVGVRAFNASGTQIAADVQLVARGRWF